MFSSLGLFKHIKCPQKQDCILPNCIFSHTNSGDDGQENENEYDPLSAGDTKPPPSKRRRIDIQSPEKSKIEKEYVLDNKVSSSKSEVSLASAQHERNPLRSTVATQALTNLNAPKATTNSDASSGLSSRKPVLNSSTRPVTPPPKASKKSENKVINNTSKHESLTPRNVAQAPAVLKTRLSILQALHTHMKVLNDVLSKGDEQCRKLSLNEQELIKFALDVEEEAATKLGQDIYRNAMAQKVLQFKKMSQGDWKKALMERSENNNKSRNREDKSGASKAKTVTTGLDNAQKETAILKQIQTSLEGLEQYGYVTTKPSDSKVELVKTALASAAGYEVCDRCGTRFQVFPGRDDHGRLTTKGHCRYHWAKLNHGRSQRSDRTTGKSDSTYLCCNRTQGSEGCVEGETHVFKVSDAARLATVLQFEHTPSTPEKREGPPISFDCEMAYTTMGMEVIRLTAVSWPKGEMLLDCLVRPYGEILDLNTRFSGVSKEQFASAQLYDTKSSCMQNFKDGRLYKIESPAVARKLLFDLISPTTPLIGHAIENDLNTCRIIHPFVVDTVLLYPHPRGLPIRYGLRMLAQKYLARSIQMGGESGHDSKEDAIATGDLVTLKVAEKWKTMKLEGWIFNDSDSLIPPDTTKTKAFRL